MVDLPENTTVMIVDDDPTNLAMLKRMLETSGRVVQTFPEGEGALDMARNSPPDLVILDIIMPGLNGFQICERMKSSDKLKDIPVLFISGLTNASDKVKAFSVGGVDFITKPFHIEEVRARVDTHLRLRKMQLELESYNHHLEDLVRKKAEELYLSQQATIIALAKLAESRDDITGTHIERTQTICRLIATKLSETSRYNGNINESYIQNITFASVLHDIGKVGIEDKILMKPEKLNDAEFEVMKNHTTIGASTLQMARVKYPKNVFLNMGIAIARSHHERWDGNGYPDGLTGEDIPLSARIMAIADVYDALRSKRPYKPNYSHERSCEMIVDASGTHFDPIIVDIFSSLKLEFEAMITG